MTTYLMRNGSGDLIASFSPPELDGKGVLQIYHYGLKSHLGKTIMLKGDNTIWKGPYSGGASAPQVIGWHYFVTAKHSDAVLRSLRSFKP